MWAHGCFWLLLGIPIGKLAHNRAIRLRQTNKKKKSFCFELNCSRRWLNGSLLSLSLFEWFGCFHCPDSSENYYFMLKSWLYFVLHSPHLERFVILIFSVFTSFYFFSMILALKTLLMCFCYMYHLSKAIFRHLLVLFHFKNFPNICYVLFFLHHILVSSVGRHVIYTYWYCSY